MNPWLLALLVAALIVAFLVGLVLVLRVLAKQFRAHGAAELAKRYPPSELLRVETLAQSFGLESLGVTQARGNGALALTPKELCFLMYVPERELRIPLTDVQAVTLVRAHLGKTTGRKLLHVRFAKGPQSDSIAWYLPDVPAWKKTLEASLPRPKKR